MLFGLVEFAEHTALTDGHHLVAEVKVPRVEAEELDQELRDAFLVLASKFLVVVKRINERRTTVRSWILCTAKKPESCHKKPDSESDQ